MPGPAGSLKGALDLLGSGQRIDGAIPDVNLRGELIFPVAALLVGRGVPFVFTTGYDASVIPHRFVRFVRCEKPVNVRRIAQVIGRVIHA